MTTGSTPDSTGDDCQRLACQEDNLKPSIPNEERAPFVVQVGSALYMVAAEDSTWVLAQLQFDAVSCTFIETSRVRYGWPREAFGALLTRFAVGDVVDPWMIDRVTEDFTTWLGQQFVNA